MANTCSYSLKVNEILRGDGQCSVKVHSAMNTLIPQQQCLLQFDKKYAFKLKKNVKKKPKQCATYKKHMFACRTNKENKLEE